MDVRWALLTISTEWKSYFIRLPDAIKQKHQLNPTLITLPPQRLSGALLCCLLLPALNCVSARSCGCALNPVANPELPPCSGISPSLHPSKQRRIPAQLSQKTRCTAQGRKRFSSDVSARRPWSPRRVLGNSCSAVWRQLTRSQCQGDCRDVPAQSYLYLVCLL